MSSSRNRQKLFQRVKRQLLPASLLEPFECAQLPSEWVCFVCLEVPTKPAMCPTCKQLVCMPCMFQWLQQSPCCPHCKQDIRNQQLLIPSPSLLAFCRLYHDPAPNCIVHRIDKSLYCAECRSIVCPCCEQEGEGGSNHCKHEKSSLGEAKNKVMERLWEGLLNPLGEMFKGGIESQLQATLDKTLKGLEDAKQEALLTLEKFCYDAENEIEKQYQKRRKSLQSQIWEEVRIRHSYESLQKIRDQVLNLPSLQKLMTVWPDVEGRLIEYQQQNKLEVPPFKSLKMFLPDFTRLEMRVGLAGTEELLVRNGVQWKVNAYFRKNRELALKISPVSHEVEGKRFWFKFRIEGREGQKVQRSGTFIAVYGKEQGFANFLEWSQAEDCMYEGKLKVILELRQEWFGELVQDGIFKPRKKQRLTK